MTFATLHNHWQALPRERKRLLAAGWLLVALMTAYLVVRPLHAAWQANLRWQALATQASTLAPAHALAADDWGRLASASALVLSAVRSSDGAWQLAGRMERADALAGFISRASARGWRADDWRLSNDAEGLHFELQLRPRQGAPAS